MIGQMEKKAVAFVNTVFKTRGGGMSRILHDHMAGMEDFFSAGGPLMIPLVVMSVLMWALIINRIFFFRRLFRKNMSRKTALAHVKAAQLPDPGKYRGAVALLVNGFLRQAQRPGRDGSVYSG